MYIQYTNKEIKLRVKVISKNVKKHIGKKNIPITVVMTPGQSYATVCDINNMSLLIQTYMLRGYIINSSIDLTNKTLVLHVQDVRCFI